MYIPDDDLGINMVTGGHHASIVLFQTTCSWETSCEFEIGALFSQLTGDDDIEIGINTEEIWTDEKAGLSGPCSNLEWEQNQRGTKPKLKQTRGRIWMVV